MPTILITGHRDTKHPYRVAGEISRILRKINTEPVAGVHMPETARIMLDRGTGIIAAEAAIVAGMNVEAYLVGDPDSTVEAWHSFPHDAERFISILTNPLVELTYVADEKPSRPAAQERAKTVLATDFDLSICVFDGRVQGSTYAMADALRAGGKPMVLINPNVRGGTTLISHDPVIETTVPKLEVVAS